MSDLKEIFLEELQDIYHAEKQLLKALPKMAKAAQNAELRAGFEEHLAQTEDQIIRLEGVFEAFGEKPKAKPCKAMKGLLEEGDEVIKEHKKDPAGDALLICAAQKVEHYEIATYGTLCTWAELLQNDEALQLLKETMAEEEETDERLSDLAESCINLEAMGGQSESEDEEEEPPSTARGMAPKSSRKVGSR